MALYKRSNFITNKAFQYKISFMICLCVLVSSLMYPLVILDLFNKLIELQPSNSSTLEESRNSLIQQLIIAESILLIIIFFTSLLITHKISGPMHKLKNYMRTIREGSPITTLSFRKGDYFQEVADEISETMIFIQNQKREELEYLNEVSDYIDNVKEVLPDDKKPVINEILHQLAQMKQRL